MMAVGASAPQIDNEVYEFLPCGIHDINIFGFWKIPPVSVFLYPPDIGRLKYTSVYFGPHHNEIPA